MNRKTLLATTFLASVSMSAATFANEGKSFDQIDQDGDGNLSQQELQMAGKNVDVKKLDKDNDDVISKREYEEAKEEWKNKKGQQQQQQRER